MTKVAYIDGDILPYKVGFATQRTIYVIDVEGEHTCSPLLITRSKVKVNKWLKTNPDLLVSELEYLEEPMQAINTLKLSIQAIVKGSGCNRFKVVLSGDDNFREDVATIQKYKGNRDGSVKPHYWQMLREWIMDKPYCIVSENEEADDVLSKAMMEGHVGCTIDKDLDNTPGFHYNFNKKLRYNINEEEARHHFYMQMLMGDKADHIPKIPGIGPAKAAKVLEGAVSVLDYETAIRPLYRSHYGKDWWDAMEEVGQLLWMRREDGEMWRPIIDKE